METKNFKRQSKHIEKEMRKSLLCILTVFCWTDHVVEGYLQTKQVEGRKISQATGEKDFSTCTVRKNPNTTRYISLILPNVQKLKSIYD